MVYRRSAIAVAFATALFAMTIRASPVVFRIDRHRLPAASEIRLTLRPVVAGDGIERIVPAASESITVDLSPGDWSVDASSADVWHQRQFFTSSDQRMDVVVALWPGGTLTGSIDNADVRSATIRFTAPDAEEPVMQAVDVVDRRFTCRVPAGVVDVRVRSRGTIARYFWQRRVAAGQSVDLGRMKLEPGASLIGTVAGEQNLSKVVVEAAATDAGPSAKLSVLQATATARGFFHLDGLPPGRYSLKATAGGASSAPVDVDVIAGAEARLHDPLVLETPKSLAIEISPPLDPQQQKWRVTIARDVTSSRSEILAEEPASRDGIASPRRLPVGHYSVTIGPAAGGKWQTREVELLRDETLAFDMSTHALRGVVKLGDRPLAARLSFGGEYGAQRIAAQSEEDGAFHVDLPASSDNVWDVAVESEVPPLKRTIHGVKATDDDVVIQLPNTIVSGSVVDGNGKAVAGALVNVLTSDEPVVQIASEAEGSFAIHGLAPGTYFVHATGYLVESEAVRLTIPADGAADDVRLVVRPNRQFAGQVVSAAGPVAGASVIAVPTDVAASFLMMPTTDERGEFDVLLPPGCREVDVFVAAPGFVYRALHLALAAGAKTTIVVDQEGGALTARWPSSELRPFLFHEGAMFEADRLVRQWNGRMLSPNELTASQMESGTYTLCMLTLEEIDVLRMHKGAMPQDGRCTSALVPRFASALIEARPR